MYIALVAIIETPGVLGGIDRQYEGLHQEIIRQGHRCDLIKLVISDKTYEYMLKGYLDCYDLDLSKYDGVISTKVPSYMVRHKNHVSYLSHRHRQFYDIYTYRHEMHERFRDIVHKLDNWGLSDANVKKRFCIGQTVRDREIKWSGYDPAVLYHPTSGVQFRTGGRNDYFLAVSRLNDHKRLDYAIKAIRQCPDARLKIIGTGPEEENLKQLARGCDQIEFLGRVDDDVLVKTYEDCLGVIFTPREEDLGLITIEAFLSGKPVITCEDSGEPAIIVRLANGGFIEKDPDGIAVRIRELMEDPGKAASLGQNGHRFMQTITWENTVRKLIEALQE